MHFLYRNRADRTSTLETRQFKKIDRKGKLFSILPIIFVNHSSLRLVCRGDMFFVGMIALGATLEFLNLRR
jgi:hypothetical protein